MKKAFFSFRVDFCFVDARFLIVLIQAFLIKKQSRREMDMPENDKLSLAREAYANMRRGLGNEASLEEALDNLNGPRAEGLMEYLLLMDGGRIVRLDGRLVIFTSETKGRLFHTFSRAGSDLVRATKAELLKQINPDLEVVVDPGSSPTTSPGSMMALSELPAMNACIHRALNINLR
ncbi:MAG: hypothetical protein WC120_04135 [Parcubacteria group bacterium]